MIKNLTSGCVCDGHYSLYLEFFIDLYYCMNELIEKNELAD